MAWVKADTKIKTATPGGISAAWVKADSAVAVTNPSLAIAWVKADSAIATIEPGLVGGWIKADSQTKLVNPPGIPVCTPGETKCVGYDLYTCSLESTWVLTKKNATECGYAPEKKFPWLEVGVGSGIVAAFIAIIAALKKKKEIK